MLEKMSPQPEKKLEKSGFSASKKKLQMILLSLAMLTTATEAVAKTVENFSDLKEKIKKEIKAEEDETLKKLKENGKQLSSENINILVDKEGNVTYSMGFAKDDKEKNKPLWVMSDEITKNEEGEGYSRLTMIDKDADGDVDRSLIAKYDNETDKNRNSAADKMKLFQEWNALLKEAEFSSMGMGGTDDSKIYDIKDSQINVINFESGKNIATESQSTDLNLNENFKHDLEKYSQ
ncbi:MAG: hypothetical protein GF365_00040 [Candidatus Buchananbacteria bacterium]|nr:hypothetical protein [Candidatus Buchananbacteria bacterium]